MAAGFVLGCRVCFVCLCVTSRRQVLGSFDRCGFFEGVDRSLLVAAGCLVWMICILGG